MKTAGGIVTAALLALLTFPGPRTALAAQSPGHASVAPHLVPGARAGGLGHAYPIGMPDADVLFENPALLVSTAGMTLGLQLPFPSVLGIEAAAAAEWYGGAVGVGARALHHPVREPGQRPGGATGIVDVGGDGTSELVAIVGYARAVAGFQVGWAGKLVSQRFSDQSETGVAFDVGVARTLGRLTVGLAVRDVGRERGFDRGAPDPPISRPISVHAGASGHGMQLGPLDLGAAVVVGRRHDGELLLGGGIEIGYWPVIGRTFVVRTGVRRDPDPGGATPFTFGGAFWGDAIRVEYAWQPVRGVDDIHRFSVGWR